MTRFRDVQQAIIMATVWVDDDKIKSDYNMKETWNYVCVVKPNDKTSDTNDDVTTKTNTVHMKRDTWQVSVHSLHTTSRGSSCARVCTHLIYAWSERHSSTLSSPFHPTSSSLYSPSISRSSCCPSTSKRISCNTVYSANKEMGSTDESYSHTVEEQPSKKLEKSYTPQNGKKRRQGCCSYCENCTTVELCLARLRSIRTSEKRKVSGKPEAAIRRVRFTQSTLRQASIWENKGPSLGKIPIKNSSSAKSLRYKIWRQISRRDWTTRAMRPEQGMESCQKYYKVRGKGQSYILFAYQWVDYAGRIHLKTGGERVCGRFWSKYAYGQQERP